MVVNTKTKGLRRRNEGGRVMTIYKCKHIRISVNKYEHAGRGANALFDTSSWASVDDDKRALEFAASIGERSV